jgi:hypothetical protein
MNEWRQKYSRQKSHAKTRGIPFELTYAQWLEIWGDKIVRRGPHKDELVMCRTRDEGGYTVGNVRLDSPKANLQEAAVCRKVKAAASAYLPKFAASPIADGSWLSSRNHAFDEYTEEEEYAD